MELDKNYDFKISEKELKEFWAREKIYKFNKKLLSSGKKIYSIDTPPPYISGRMHIGHAFSYSQQDFIARFRRMLDGNVFYPFGTDDNGLPTERFVEKTNNVKSKDMTRADFIELCLKTLKKTTDGFIQDWKDIGLSADYDIYYSTIDKNSQKISQRSFIELYNKKEIYLHEFPTLWCTECQTTIAQAELEDSERNSLFSTLKFKADGKDILIATTRPELLPACVAVFVNPEDKRYKNLAGKNARVPLFDIEVPIIADKSADIKKGTGVLMICSFGDKYDAEAINRHKLEARIVINNDGTLNELTGKYRGMKIKAARKAIIEDLKAENLVLEQKQITHVTNVHDKCGTEIEIITTEQWFTRILDKKKELVNQGKKVKWHPEFMFKRYENWVNGLDWDWSISRNRHFGVPIPVWHCDNCDDVIVADEKELPVDPLQKSKKCPKCKKDARGEDKVFDTWATSSLTPQIADSLIGNKIKIPFSLRPQAHDIIRTWAFYTIVKAYLHEKNIPWKDIIISGNVSLGGQKMSKSKGNIVEPKKVLEQYGADALRYWASSSKLGEDLDYQEKELVTGQRFVTKIWNASRLCIMNLDNYKKAKPKELEAFDKWILIKINRLVEKCTKNLNEYEYSLVRGDATNFFWHTFCDNYLEIIKDRLYNEDRRGKDAKLSAQYTLYSSLLNILKLMAPITPFVTEKIYMNYFAKHEGKKSIHLESWPEYDEKMQDKNIEEIGDKAIEAISEVRKEKARLNKPMNSEIKELIVDKKLKLFEEDLKAVAKAEKISYGDFKIVF